MGSFGHHYMTPNDSGAFKGMKLKSKKDALWLDDSLIICVECEGHGGW